MSMADDLGAAARRDAWVEAVWGDAQLRPFERLVALAFARLAGQLLERRQGRRAGRVVVPFDAVRRRRVSRRPGRQGPG